MTNNNISSKPSKKIDSFFHKYWVTFILSVLCAIAIWGFILMNENPDRTKVIRDVPVTFDGEADLLTRHLAVVGDRSEILPDVNVKIKIDLLNYADLSTKDVTAVASLRQVNGEGVYELLITATSSKGNVLNINPSSVKVTIDRLNIKKIPIEIDTKNELKKGLSAGEIVTTSKQIQIEGANAIISRIEKAVYVIDLADVVESVNASVSLTLIDNLGNNISQNEIYGEIPSVVVKMPIHYYKEVDFDIDGNVINTDLINENFEIVSMYCEPSTVKIFSDTKSDVSSISQIDIEKIDVTDAKANITKKVGIKLPDNTWLEGGADKVTVKINIREKQVERTFNKLKIIVSGEKSKLQYRYDVTAVDITIKCSISIANSLTRDMIKLYIDVADFDEPGKYVSPISCHIDQYDTTDMVIRMSSDKAYITIE